MAGSYSITNNSNGNGISFTTTITGGQVTFPDASSYSYAGTRIVTQTAGIGISMKGTLDYGTGDCDSMATIKVGATTKTAGLP